MQATTTSAGIIRSVGRPGHIPGDIGKSGAGSERISRAPKGRSENELALETHAAKLATRKGKVVGTEFDCSRSRAKFQYNRGWAEKARTREGPLISPQGER